MGKKKKKRISIRSIVRIYTSARFTLPILHATHTLPYWPGETNLPCLAVSCAQPPAKAWPPDL